MELRKITLKNVRHWELKEFDFDGNKEIIMPNKGGKSTLADAITFLFTGKLYSGSSDIASLKPVKDTSLEVSIQGVIVDESGIKTVVEKTYKENWVKTRGTSDYELKGHITTCFIDEEKMTVSNYESKLCGYFNVNNMTELNILVNPYYFSQNLDWKQRLEYIKRVTGEIKPSDVLSIEPLLQPIEEDLLSKPVDSLKRRYFTDIKDKKEEIKTKEIQIKSYDVDGVITEQEYKDAKTKIDSNQKTITDLEVKMQGIKNPVLENLKEQKQAKQEEINQSIQEDSVEVQRQNKAINDRIDVLREEKQSKEEIRNAISAVIRDIDRNIESASRETQQLQNALPSKIALKQSYVDRWYAAKNKVFEPSPSVLCPECGCDISEESNKKAEAEFNITKAQTLKDITTKGQEIKAEIEDIEQRIETLKQEIVNHENAKDIQFKKRDEINDEINDIQFKINQENAKKSYTFTSEKTKKLREELQSINNAIQEEQYKVIDPDNTKEQIRLLKEENAGYQEIIDNYNAQLVLKKKKAEFEKELGKLIEGLSKSENKMDLLTLYTETYLKMLKERLDIHFPGIQFKLIEENIKADSWNETCYVMDQTEFGLVPYETTNTASKIKIGVELATKLAEALGWSKAPIIIDNAEAVTKTNRVFDTDVQVITLVADDVQPRVYAEEPKQTQIEFEN